MPYHDWCGFLLFRLFNQPEIRSHCLWVKIPSAVIATKEMRKNTKNTTNTPIKDDNILVGVFLLKMYATPFFSCVFFGIKVGSVIYIRNMCCVSPSLP